MGLGAWLGWRESGLAEIGSVDLYLKWTCGGDSRLLYWPPLVPAPTTTLRLGLALRRVELD